MQLERKRQRKKKGREREKLSDVNIFKLLSLSNSSSLVLYNNFALSKKKMSKQNFQSYVMLH